MTAPQQQRLKMRGPVVVTANRLGDGVVVYLAHDGSWSTNLQHAIVTTTTEEASRLLAGAFADELRAVGAYLAPVEISPGGKLSPANLRERIRRNGPSFVTSGTATSDSHVHLR